MSLSIQSLASKKGARTKSFRIGRGPGTGRGKTAGRGTKGQRARTGGRNKLKMLGMKQMILGYPKLRGFTSRYAKATVIPIAKLNRFEDGKLVDLQVLKEARLANRSAREAKIVGGGELTKKLTVKGVMATASAQAAIAKAGGKYVG